MGYFSSFGFIPAGSLIPPEKHTSVSVNRRLIHRITPSVCVRLSVEMILFLSSCEKSLLLVIYSKISDVLFLTHTVDDDGDVLLLFSLRRVWLTLYCVRSMSVSLFVDQNAVRLI